MIEFTIPQQHPSLNELMRAFRNAHKRARERDSWHWLVYTHLPAEARTAPPITSCRVKITRIGKKPLDWDNFIAKFLLDGLVSNKVLADDKPAVVRSIEWVQEIEPRREPATRIEITDVEY